MKFSHFWMDNLNNKKDRIINAAIDVFRQMGIEKAKIADITQKAGVAQGTFYLYFPSKLSVMPDIAEKMVLLTVDDIQASVDVNAPFSQQLEQIVDSVFRQIKAHRDIHAFIHAGLAQTGSLKEWESLYQPFYEQMSRFLEHFKTEGILRQSLCAQDAAKLVIGLIESTAEQVYLYDTSKESTEDLRKNQLLDFLCHALLSES